MYYPQNEMITLSRECSAVIIPAGEDVTLPEGTTGSLTQALGGSFTLYIEGNLFQIAGVDADALGKEPTKPPVVPPNATKEDFESLIWQQLKTCYDPEIPINIVDLGLVYRCEIEHTDAGQRIVEVDMTLTAPGCGMGEIIMADVRQKIEIVPTVERADVELVFDPPWNQAMMSEVARLEAGLL